MKRRAGRQWQINLVDDEVLPAVRKIHVGLLGLRGICTHGSDGRSLVGPGRLIQPVHKSSNSKDTPVPVPMVVATPRHVPQVHAHAHRRPSTSIERV